LFPRLEEQFFIINLTNQKMAKKPSTEEMWVLIEKILLQYDDMPDKTKMSDDQVFELYSMVKEAGEMFRMLNQIAILKKAIDDMSNR